MNIEEFKKTLNRKKQYRKRRDFCVWAEAISAMMMVAFFIANLIDNDRILLILCGISAVLFIITFILACVNIDKENQKTEKIINMCKEIKMKNSKTRESFFFQNLHYFPDKYLMGPIIKGYLIIVAVYKTQNEEEIKVHKIDMEQANKLFEL